MKKKQCTKSEFQIKSANINYTKTFDKNIFFFIRVKYFLCYS